MAYVKIIAAFIGKSVRLGWYQFTVIRKRAVSLLPKGAN